MEVKSGSTLGSLMALVTDINITEALSEAVTVTERPLSTITRIRLLPSMFLTFKIATKLQEYSIFVLFIIGTVGNLLSLAVLNRKSLSTSTTSVYLRALTISDTVTLTSYLLYGISNFYQPQLINDPFCKIVLWMQSSFQQISSYLVIVMTAERLAAVVFPLKVGRLFTKRIAYILCAVVYICFMLINITYFVITESFRNNICRFKKRQYGSLLKVWSKADSIISSYIPAIVILILNIFIITHMIKAKKEQYALNEGKDAGSKSLNQTKQITNMLLAISIAYWILNVPMAIYFGAREYFFNYRSAKDYAASYLTQAVCVFLMLTNNTVNFYLYCLTGNRFRQELKDLLCCKKQSPLTATRITSVTTSSKN